MVLGNILVHMDSKARTATRLSLAVRVAKRVEARLTGVFTERADPWPSPHNAAAAESARAAFEAAAAPLGERTGFIDLKRGGDHDILPRFVEVARTFDLVILGQTQDDVPVPVKLPEQTILDSGRPVLVVPYVGTYRDVGSRPLFAWRSSRGAARAVLDALPLLAQSCDALVVEVARANEPRDEFADLLVANLKTHGVAARYQRFVVDEISVMDTLLSAVSDHAADLLAIGAFDQGTHALFGHGTGTRHILAHMTTPVLFSH